MNAHSSDTPPRRDFRCSFTQNLAPIFTQLGASLLISSYHVGELVSVSVGLEGLELSFHHFERAMGIAIRENQLAVGTQRAIWFLASDDDLAAAFSRPAGTTPASLHARPTSPARSRPTSWPGRATSCGWSTRGFGCLCTLDDRHSFVPRWRPPFLTALAAEDRCHLNGLAMAEGARNTSPPWPRPTSRQGWRPNKATSGCLIDVASGRRCPGLRHAPLAPRPPGRVWMLHSGRGRLVVVDPARGTAETVTELPGYTRGLA